MRKCVPNFSVSFHFPEIFVFPVEFSQVFHVLCFRPLQIFFSFRITRQGENAGPSRQSCAPGLCSPPNRPRARHGSEPIVIAPSAGSSNCTHPHLASHGAPSERYSLMFSDSPSASQFEPPSSHPMCIYFASLRACVRLLASSSPFLHNSFFLRSGDAVSGLRCSHRSA